MRTPDRAAVFLDRDGTINVEVNYLRRAEDFRLLPGAGEGIGLLNRAGLKVIVASNQSGVARGYFTARELARITRKMRRELKKCGARVDAVYYCTSHPEENSSCRKPEIGLALKAREKFDLDLRRCFMVGDSRTDIEFGRRMGARTVLVTSGQARGDEDWVSELRPDCLAQDLLGAALWILQQEKGA